MIESSAVRRALTRVRDEISPTRDDKARLRARILAPAALLGPESAGHGATAPARAAPLTAWAALKAAGSVGAAAGLALLGIGGGVGFWLGHEMASSHPQSAAAFERLAPAIEAPPPELDRSAAGPPASTIPAAPSPPTADVVAASAAEGAEVSEPRREPHPSGVPSRAQPAQRRARPNPLDAELALLRRVERALRNDDPSLARALLGELDERFPDSRLAEERSAARRIADCRSGEPGASESARTFLREHGASVYRKRIARACALESEKSSTPPMTIPESADTHDR